MKKIIVKKVVKKPVVKMAKTIPTKKTKTPIVKKKSTRKFDNGGVAGMFKDPSKLDKNAGKNSMLSYNTLKDAGTIAATNTAFAAGLKGATVGGKALLKKTSKKYAASVLAKETAKKAAAIGVAKTVGKGLGKLALKAIPGVGLAITAGEIGMAIKDNYDKGVEKENNRLKEYNTSRYDDGSKDYTAYNKDKSVKTTVTTHKGGDKTVRTFNKVKGKSYSHNQPLGGKKSKTITKKIK